LQAGADAKRVRLESEAASTRAQQLGEAEAAATRARGLAEGDAVRAKGLAEAEAIAARAEALATDQEAVIGQQIAERLPEIVAEAAKAFGNIDQLSVPNGAEGMSQMFSQVLGMGAASIPLLRGMIEQTNGHGAGNGTGPDAAKPRARADQLHPDRALIVDADRPARPSDPDPGRARVPQGAAGRIREDSAMCQRTSPGEAG
jgi:hypothetical protein